MSTIRQICLTWKKKTTDEYYFKFYGKTQVQFLTIKLLIKIHHFHSGSIDMFRNLKIIRSNEQNFEKEYCISPIASTCLPLKKQLPIFKLKHRRLYRWKLRNYTSHIFFFSFFFISFIHSGCRRSWPSRTSCPLIY